MTDTAIFIAWAPRLAGRAGNAESRRFPGRQTRPITRTSTMTTATTKRMWMNPPMVWLLTSPNTQRINKTTAKVHNMGMLLGDRPL